ncbi:hypothetical protein Tco_0046221 [Tanacetum coccineum]
MARHPVPNIDVFHNIARSGRIWLSQAGYGRSCRGLAKYGRVWPNTHGTPASRSSRSGDHQRSRRDSPEYDRSDGRAVSKRYSDGRDYRDCSEPLPRHGRDYRHLMTTSS